MLAADPRWGICGVSLKTPRAIEPLAAQDGLYTLLTRTSDGVTRARDRRACARRCSPAPHARALVARFADPRDHDRVVDRHREGLLPRSGHRRAQRRASGHRARPRASRRAGIGDRHRSSRGSPRAAPRARARSPSSAATTCRTTAAWSKASCTRSRSGATRRSRAGSRDNVAFPVDDGRPHRAGHHRRRHRRGSAPARRARRGAGRPPSRSASG